LNNKTKTELEGAKCAIQWSNPAFALTHESRSSIDDKQALVLSQNLTTFHSVKTVSNDVLIQIQQMFRKSVRFSLTMGKKIFFTTATSDIIASPNNSRAALTTLLTNATKLSIWRFENIDEKHSSTLLSDKQNPQQYG